MPWEVKSVEMIREEFVKQVLADSKKKNALCKQYGISRPTGDKWLKRYQAGEGFKDRSHRTFRTPANKITASMEEEIVRHRRKVSGIGAVKLKRLMQNEGITGLPSHSTINAVFKRNNLIDKKDSEGRKPTERFEHAQANDLWQADFKGNFLLEDGQRCYPLSIIDDCSRFCVCMEAKENEQREGVLASLVWAFTTYGQPKALLCDNGNPWGDSRGRGYTKLELWLLEHSVLIQHIRPGRPKTQGKVERFNRSYKDERLKQGRPANMQAAREQCLEYREFYNNTRPHHALKLDVPGSRYQVSKISFQEEVIEWQYSGEHQVQKVNSNGYLTIGKNSYYFSESFAGKLVELKESKNVKSILNVCFREYLVAKLNKVDGYFFSKKPYLIIADPRVKGDIFVD